MTPLVPGLTRLPPELTAPLSGVAFAIGVLVFAVGILRLVPSGRLAPAEFAASLSLGLEFLLAAGIIRLSSINDFTTLGAVGAIVLIRRVIGIGLKLGVRAVLGVRAPTIRA